MSKKGENIYKRKDGRWEARYIRGYGDNGAPKYGYCYAKTYGLVKEKQTALKAEVLAGNLAVPNKKCPFSQLCQEWLTMKRGGVKESTYVKYEITVQNHIIPKLGGYPMSELSSARIAVFGRELCDKDRLSPKTVRDILVVLNAIIKYASKETGTGIAPQVIYPRSEYREMRVLSVQEQKALTAYLLKNTDNYKFGALLALHTGMRIGEICALRWKNVSLSERCITVDSTMQRLKNTEFSGAKTIIFTSAPKSGASIRCIPIGNTAVALLKGFYVRNPDAYVLTGNAERFIEPRTLQNHMTKYATELGLFGVHFHSLRHSFATRCIEVGFDIKSLSEILGHAGVQITLERYVHSSMELKRANMEKLSVIGF